MSSRPVVELAVLDVGQGDTIVVSVPATREAVIIDCVDPDPVFTYLRDRKIQHLRGLVLTHLHLDHYRGALSLLRNCEQKLNLRCEALYYHWDRASAAADQPRLLRDQDQHDDEGLPERLAVEVRKTQHGRMLDWASQNRELCKRLAREKDHIFFPGTFEHVLELVHPWYANLHELSASGLNDTSAVIRVHGRGATALLMGDIEAAAWRMITAGNEEIQADVLKFPHHGAWAEGDPGEVLDKVNPKVLVISVGTQGAVYDHPHQSVLSAVRERAPLMRLLCTQATQKCGAIDDAVQDLTASVHAHHLGNLQSNRPRRGCSCAGSVIVSLGETLEVLRPSIPFHQDSVIGRFYPNHQCALFQHLPRRECGETDQNDITRN